MKLEEIRYFAINQSVDQVAQRTADNHSQTDRQRGLLGRPQPPAQNADCHHLERGQKDRAFYAGGRKQTKLMPGFQTIIRLKNGNTGTAAPSDMWTNPAPYKSAVLDS